MNERRQGKSLLVVAGEVSGDMHAAGVIRELKKKIPDLHVFGVGGDALAAEGVEVLHHVRDMAVMGMWEVLKKYRFFRRTFDHLVKLAAERKPDAVLLIDYPGFNLRFAREARALGLKVIYYVCPQVWAWKQSRIPQMAECIDRLLSIFPFEAAYFSKTSLKVDFVGHPLVDEAAEALARPPARLPWTSGHRVALLPGSRRQEIERIFPVMWAAAGRLEREAGPVSFLVAAPSGSIASELEKKMNSLPGGPSSAKVITGSTREVLRQAQAAWVKSGTSIMEAALMGCPYVLVYKTSPLTYAIAKRVVKTDYIGIVNVIAGKEVCPELIQDRATPERLVTALRPLLEDTPTRKNMLSDIAAVKASLGAGGAARNVAAILAEELGAGSA